MKIIEGNLPLDGADYHCGYRDCDYHAQAMHYVTWEIAEKYNMAYRAICAYHEGLIAGREDIV